MLELALGESLLWQCLTSTFIFFSERVCASHATIFNVKFQFFSVYFPTFWEHGEVVEHLYDFLNVLISTCVREGATPLVAGDLNASIARALPHDELQFLGFCGCGHRNARGWTLIEWVLGNGLLIQNRMDTTMNNDASWTCHRPFDGALVQLDFVEVLSSSCMTLVRVWCDHRISVGLDHRCVHCICALTKRMRNWMPRLDSSDQPSQFQAFVRAFAHFGSKSWNYRFGKYSCGCNSCYWTLSSKNTAISSFAPFSSTSVTTAPCTKSTMSERTEPLDSITPS